jgi:RNA polymerase sigma-54 factor
MRLSFSQVPELTQKPVQTQTLSPQMIQSMEILQLSLAALEERIEKEMLENPVLELQESDPDLPPQTSQADTEQSPSGGEEAEGDSVSDDNLGNDDLDRLMNMDEDWPDRFGDRPRPSRNEVDEAGERKLDAMANIVARPQSLQDYLQDQLGWFDLDPALRAMAERIIYDLDPNGYLSTRLEDLLASGATGDELALAQQALALVQRLDPPGVGARDLRECLLLQLTPGMPYREQLQRLIASHLEDLEHNRLPAISRRTGYSIDLIRQTLAELRKLDPKPGDRFNNVLVPPITPDVLIEQGHDGKCRVCLEDGRTPNLLISPYYRKLFSGGQITKETREYIKKKVASAQWLIASIQQRRNTLTRVAQAIVDHQSEFLSKGPAFIEPLKMQQIAEKVNVHVTTVSRAVADKWIQTPRGIFPLKRFFCGGTVSAEGEEVAWNAIRLKLQELIDSEDKQHPKSDDQLVKNLADSGITVARRTVTKYREAMRIPSSRQRRDWSSQ